MKNQAHSTPVVSGALALAASCGLLCACGPGASTAKSKRDLSQFQCNERQVSYMLAGGFAADETGITMECKGNDPHIVKWRSDDGKRKSSSFPLSGEQFDEVWDRIDATGWRQLEQDCNNPDAEEGDPSYLIDVSDYALSITINCDGKTLPFPYDRIVNELDLRAAGFGDQDHGVR